MKLDFFPETDSLYIELNSNPSADAREIAKGVVIDFDADGNVVGIDIDHASKKVNLHKLDCVDLPLIEKKKLRRPVREAATAAAGKE